MDRFNGPSPSHPYDYEYGGEEHGFLAGPSRREAEARRLADLAQVPPEAWSAEDVRAVIRSQPYQDSRDPARAAWQARVRACFEEQVRREEAERSGAADTPGEPTNLSHRSGGGEGGMVSVSAYTRRGGHGSVHVPAHRRSAPG